MMKVGEFTTHSLRKAAHPTSYLLALLLFQVPPAKLLWLHGAARAAMEYIREAFLISSSSIFFTLTITLYAASRKFISFGCSVRIIPHRTDSFP
jgi:hypothetical protein